MSRRRRRPIELLEETATVEPGSLGAHVREYLEHLGVRGQTEASIRSESAHLRLLLAWAEDRGIRRLEAIHLDLYDVDLEEGTLYVRQGKGKKDRLIPLGERAALWLAKYVEEVRPYLVSEPDDGALFLTHLRGRFSPEGISNVVRKAFDAAGVTGKGSCHVFRHTVATLMLEGGADLRFVQALLGHADITSTQVYTHVALRKLKEVYERTHPGARLARREPAAGDEKEPTRDELLMALDAEAVEEDED